jgi:hypothetical protein
VSLARLKLSEVARFGRLCGASPNLLLRSNLDLPRVLAPKDDDVDPAEPHQSTKIRACVGDNKRGCRA